MHRTLNALFHHCARRLIRLVDIAVEMIVVRTTSARTDEFGETVFAFLSRKQARILEFFSQIRSFNARKHTAHSEFFIPCKLMAGIQIPVRRHREIFVPRTARRNALGKARTAL